MQQAAGAGNTGQRQGMLDDYNPFAEGNQTRPAGGVSIDCSFIIAFPRQSHTHQRISALISTDLLLQFLR